MRRMPNTSRLSRRTDFTRCQLAMSKVKSSALINYESESSFSHADFAQMLILLAPSRAIQSIVDEADKLEKAPPVGILTGINRDNWTKVSSTSSKFGFSLLIRILYDVGTRPPALRLVESCNTSLDSFFRIPHLTRRSFSHAAQLDRWNDRLQ